MLSSNSTLVTKKSLITFTITMTTSVKWLGLSNLQGNLS